MAIFTKKGKRFDASGKPLYGPVNTSIVFAGFGGPCEARNNGDAVVRYDQLLQIYFSVIADPTLLDRQGPDSGTQYRSALVPLNAEQARVARAYLQQLGKSGLWNRPLVTRIEPFKGFFPAEDYHQDFAARNPDHGYIQRWDAPKVQTLKAFYPGLYKSAFTTG